MPTYTYSGDPASTPRDSVRWLVGDVEGVNGNAAKWNVSDEEIAFAVSGSESFRHAAVMVARAIAAKFSKLADQSMGDDSISYSQIASAFAARAEELENWIAAGAGSASPPRPWAGGIDVSDKKATYDDQSLVGGHVTPGFMDNLSTAPGGPVGYTWER